MTALIWLLRGLLMWLGLALPVGIGIGRAIRLRDQAPAVEPDPRDGWSDEAVRAEFDRLIPDLVTADVFALDAQMNRRAGWER